MSDFDGMTKKSTAAEPTTTATENKPSSLLSEETILIVDDEVALLDLAQEQIEGLGYRVYAANNGQQALQLLSEHSEINLMFSDVVMPGDMNGYELALKAKDLKPNLKLLLASGFTPAAMKQRGLALFDAEILTKPYRYDDLSVKLREILDA